MSRIAGERFLIAATLDPAHEGQEFETIPPHMTVVRWFTLPDHRRKFLDHAMYHVLTDTPVFQELTGGKHARFGEHKEYPVRLIVGAEEAPAWALRTFVKGMGSFRDGDVFADTFNPHVTDTPTRSIERGEQISIPTVALIRAHPEEQMQQVVASYELGDPGRE